MIRVSVSSRCFCGFCAFSPPKPPKIAIWTNWTNDLDQFGPIPFQSFIVSLHLQKVMKRRGGDSCVPEQQEIMKKYGSHRLDFQNYLLSLQRRQYNRRQTSRRANKLYPVSKSGKFTAAWGKSESLVVYVYTSFHLGEIISLWKQFTYIYRCELIFILYATGIPEPSDEECQEGSHFCVYIPNLSKLNALVNHKNENFSKSNIINCRNNLTFHKYLRTPWLSNARIATFGICA